MTRADAPPSTDATAADSEPRAPDRPVVAVEYYTDPLCSWSWALEPAWRRLRFELGDRLAARTRMGGMIPDWSAYDDPLSAIARPGQMGPVCAQVRHTIGVPVNDRVWVEDPPASSHPACLAFHAASRQSEAAGESLLRLLREAMMVRGRNVARRDVILALATELANDGGEPFDVERLKADLDEDDTAERFRDDLREARYRQVGRFPTLIFRTEGRPGVLLTGYRPYETLRKAVEHLAPSTSWPRTPPDPLDYARRWGRVTARDVAEILGEPTEEVDAKLRDLVVRGLLRERGPIYLA